MVPIGIYKNFDLNKVKEHIPKTKKFNKMLEKKTKDITHPGKGFRLSQTTKKTDGKGFL